MMKTAAEECDRYQPPRDFSRLNTVAHNLPYALMGLCGSALLLAGFGNSPAGWLSAAAYLAYTVGGAFWIMLFVCPYCHYHGTHACPCGYGHISAKLLPRRAENQFARQFRKHIPVIVPLWVIPVAAGIAFYAGNRSLLILVLLVIFALDAFVVLPLVSRLYGCGHCPQKVECPWMNKG